MAGAKRDRATEFLLSLRNNVNPGSILRNNGNSINFLLNNGNPTSHISQINGNIPSGNLPNIRNPRSFLPNNGTLRNFLENNGNPREILANNENPRNILQINGTLRNYLENSGNPREFLANNELNPRNILPNGANPTAILQDNGNPGNIFSNPIEILQNYGNPRDISQNNEIPINILPDNGNPRDIWPNNGIPIDFFERSTPQSSNVTQLINSEPDLSLGLSLGSYCQIPQENKPIIQFSPLNRPLTLNENARSSSLPAETGQVNHRVCRRVTGKAPAVAPPPAKLSPWVAKSASKNSAFRHAMGKIISANNATPRATMQGPSSSGANIPPLFPSKSMSKGKSIHSANRSIRGPVIGCRVTKNGICDISAEEDLIRLSKRSKSSDGTIIRSVTGMELLMRLMPSVATRGPNGRRTEGFLCSYMRGYICIVCVCHGDFLTPTEFVRHAGGDDVENPMRQIKVLPFSL